MPRSARGRAPAPSTARPGPAADRAAVLPSPWVLAGAAAIVAAAFLVGWPAIRGAWLWDDDTSITANAAVRGPYSFRAIWIAPEGPDYFPLTTTAFWAEWHLFGDDVTGYHVVNIALHAISGLLVWALAAAMRLPGGWLAGMLFTVHPLCVESVAWISELKNTLAQPLFLAAAIHAVRADAADRPRVTRDDVATAGWFLAAMLAKTSVVMFPVVMLLHAWWRRGVVRPRDLLRAAPLLVVSLLLGLVTLHFQHSKAIGDEAIPVGGAASRIALAGMEAAFYLGKVILPLGLLPIYPRWEIDPPRAWQFLPWAALAAGAAWAWVNRATWGRHAILAVGFFLLMALPVLGFVTIAYMRVTWAADHFVYLPMVSLLIAAAAVAARWGASLPERSRAPAAAAGMALVAALGAAAARYGAVWVDERTLWTHTLAGNPDAWQAHNRLGSILLVEGKVDDAHEHFVAATRLRPDLSETRNNLGLTLWRKGRLPEAIEAFERSAAAAPGLALPRVNLAAVYLESGRLDDAEAVYGKLLEAFPESSMVRGRRAEVLVRQERFVEAAAQYALLLEREPGNALAWNNRGVCMVKLGRAEEAVACFRKAVAVAPNFADARQNLERMTAGAAAGPAPAPPSRP